MYTQSMLRDSLCFEKLLKCILEENGDSETKCCHVMKQDLAHDTIFPGGLSTFGHHKDDIHALALIFFPVCAREVNITCLKLPCYFNEPC